MQKLDLVLLVTICLTGCTAQQGQHTKEELDVTSEIAKIKSLSASRAKAFNEGNADVIAAAFTETGLLMAPGSKSRTGREAVRDYYQGIFDQYKTFLESGYEEVKVSGDIGYGVGFAKVKLVAHSGGDTLLSTAKYINILQRQNDGSWLTTHDIWNDDQ
jgi:uncharacterized protein (TIGR02246 family)